MKEAWVAALAAAGLAASGPASAKVKSDKDFRFPAGKPARILVFRPDVQVGSMGVGGMDEPNADWTAQARANLAEQLDANQRSGGNQVVFIPEQEGENARLVADYQQLFRAVAGAIAEHKLSPFAKLPTKKDRFDWTLGPGARRLGELMGGDYALFLYSHDAYGTTARKVMQVLVAGLFSAGMRAGVHQGYAALVELSTGRVVWFNLDPASGGDPRDREGAAKRVRELLTDFPGAGASPIKTVGR